MVGKVALLSAAASAAMAAWAVRSPASALLAPSVYRGPRNRKALALTFDDGPSPSTPHLLEVLDSYGVKATFFQCGVHVERLPEIARDVADAGHEIGNHTFSHRALWLQSPTAILDEVAKAQQSIEKHAGFRPTLFRAPYGVRWPGLREAQQAHNLLGVMWSAIGKDWKLFAEAVAVRLMRGAENGAILCLHDGRELRTAPDISNTIEAVDRAIPVLKARGYAFRTVSELLHGDPVD